ncbi:HIT-like protein [Saitoella complicata NRRL Y-17804]|uniref:Aprataxin C2HE/C2H2/C2HC zinc finger domain-containing protein n=1 Tax=Saitoella complicata (strain BCRC 22490 / CBS 7301 / JCM 7358 / NBRC 10748 / NRRL Y-17804) TaxID=698492 RepID=A0A0E9N7F6_SAICN|nr:HIT-like protein [Saitoella complicata NRRL Y-17804]ODQ54304.1 HIT-like protein [Saitoella complicata NRRL Y-17804]GAO45764.1 hypothetical protein G7K_0016-t1 [Saitoella complicata NRRL Y-17804]
MSTTEDETSTSTATVQTLMSSSSRTRPSPVNPNAHSNQAFRSALAPFLQNPTIPPCLRITDRTILIRDKYPKARIHYLLLPRNQTLTLHHPLTVLSDPVIRDDLRADVDAAISMAQNELRRAAVVGMGGVERVEVRAGIHARPSLSNLHIHIISQDFRSPALKNAKHYLSFTMPFFIPFDSIPSLKLYDHDTGGVDEERVEREVRVREEGLRRGELRCVRCGEEFGRRFVGLKRHLEGCAGRTDVAKGSGGGS